ncbi:MAG: hypothetical protein B6A08_03135 [Sorangiineae bacterium NIC37A_2]|nr:MAG: hypothetical protein B6A08_03135 [Sorangiineae bacterium NIC37A_2]
MKRASLLLLCVLPWLPLTGCKANVGAANAPSDAQDRCRSQCTSLGMELSQIALVRAEVICVCDVRGSHETAPHPMPRGAAASVAARASAKNKAKRYEQSPR